MSSLIALAIVLTVLVTTFVSGIFGMAGGMIFMGVLAAILPVATAMIVHGTIQMFSNGYRAYLWRDHIAWRIFGRYLIGSIAAVMFLFALNWRPDTQMLYLMLGIVTLLVWVPRTLLDLNIQNDFQAEFSGFIVQALNTIAGVSGPLLDMFFVKTELTRHQIVATKSATQVVAHLVKVAFWSAPVITAAGMSALPPWWLYVFAIPASMLGTTTGGLVLNRMSDLNFKRWMRWLVTGVGLVMFLRAFNVF